MAVNKKKVLRQAEKYVSKRQWDKAIAEYEKLSQEDYGDSSLQNTIGDLYLNKGDVQRAIECFEQAAEFYEKDGFVPKAIAMYRKILRLDPTLARHYHKLAQLYGDQGLVQDAITQLETLARHYERHLQVDKALETYRQIADLDPTNVAIRIKLGELYERQGVLPEAVDQYVRIGDAYARKGEIGGSYSYYKKAAALQKDNLAALKGLATVYVSTGQVDRAIETWRSILTLQPDDIPSLFSLGKILLKEGQHDQALPVFDRIAHLDPKKEGIQEIIGRIFIQRGEYEEAFKRLEPAIDVYLEEEKFEDAIKMLQQLVERAPKSIQIRSKIADLFRRLGMDERAYIEYQQIAEILIEHGKLPEAYRVYEQLFMRNPESETFKSRYQEIARAMGKTPIRPLVTDRWESASIESVVESAVSGRPATSEPPAAVSAREAGSVEVEPAAAAAVPATALTATQREKVEEYHVEVDVFIKYGLLDNAINRLREIIRLAPDDLNAHRKLQGLFEKQGRTAEAVQELLLVGDLHVQRDRLHKALEVYKEVLEHDPSNEEALARIEQLNARLFEGQPEEALAVSRAPAEVPESSDPVAELSDFANQIFLDAGLEKEMAPAPPPPPEPVELVPTGVQFMEDSATDVDVAEVVKVFREGIDRQISAKDYETHYNLGIAYREMGLVDEAIREFGLVLEHPAMAVEGADNLGLCYMDKGDFERAIEILEHGLQLVGENPEKRVGLSYDLAQAYRLAGRREDALAMLLEVDRVRKGFRNVGNEIARLRNPGA